MGRGRHHEPAIDDQGRRVADQGGQVMQLADHAESGREPFVEAADAVAVEEAGTAVWVEMVHSL